MRRRLTWLLLPFTLASCQKFAEGRQMFHDVLALRDQISNEFHETVSDINFDLGNNAVTVAFADSTLTTREQRQQRADAVAAFVASHYKHPLSQVTTKFVHKSGSWTVSDNYVGRTAH